VYACCRRYVRDGVVTGGDDSVMCFVVSGGGDKVMDWAYGRLDCWVRDGGDGVVVEVFGCMIVVKCKYARQTNDDVRARSISWRLRKTTSTAAKQQYRHVFGVCKRRRLWAFSVKRRSCSGRVLFA